MKKLIIAIIAMVTIITITASAGSVSYTPLVPKTYECLVFELDLHQTHAVEVVDEQGSKYIHTDIVPRKLTQVFYYRQTPGGKFWQCWQGHVSLNGKSLNGSGENRQAVMVMNPKDGETNGYIVFIMDIPRLDMFTPSIQCHLSGTFEGEWDKQEQRYVLKEGRGVVAGHSTPTKWSAWDFMKSAVLSVQSPMAPAWGTFTVKRAVLTDNEIITELKK